MFGSFAVEGKPKVKYSAYLYHEKEPRTFASGTMPPEVEHELLANRFFLKRRVWKNMEKIRRANRLDKFQKPVRQERLYRPRHQAV